MVPPEEIGDVYWIGITDRLGSQNDGCQRNMDESNTVAELLLCAALSQLVLQLIVHRTCCCRDLRRRRKLRRASFERSLACSHAP